MFTAPGLHGCPLECFRNYLILVIERPDVFRLFSLYVTSHKIGHNSVVRPSYSNLCIDLAKPPLTRWFFCYIDGTLSFLVIFFAPAAMLGFFICGNP